MPQPAPPSIEDQLRAKWQEAVLPSCKTCRYAYQVKPAPAADIAYQCMHSPPNMVLLPIQGGGVGVQMAPRILPAEFFCHQWRISPEQVKVTE
jgi:hypothetical protein